MAQSAVEKIRGYNQGRDPERLSLKYKAMRESKFSFLRGTCHLFYDRLPQSHVLERSPVVWACGDLHLGNFGSYKGDNRLVYFDINDFDEALLAPCSWDVLRLLTSAIVAADMLGCDEASKRELCQVFIDSYTSSLKSGKARWIERATSAGVVRRLLVDLKKRSRAGFITSRTILKKGKRFINTDGKKALPVSEEQYQRINSFMEEFAKGQSNSKFFRVLDIARRIAGTGSLGIERYAILVSGNGSPDNNYLLDLKHALPSSLVEHTGVRQPLWKTEAERVISVQRYMQAISPAFLYDAEIDGKSYILKELQPTQDRINLNGWGEKLGKFRSLMATIGEITAWDQLRSCGRKGSVSVDELMDFASGDSWNGEMFELALVCARIVEEDYSDYCEAYDDGFFKDK